jgi:Sec23/Sec24 trunk domain
VGFIFIVDVCIEEEELRFLKNEMLHVISQLPEKSMVGLVSFGSMVSVHDLKCTDCSRVLVLHCERELSSDKVTFSFELFSFVSGNNAKLKVLQHHRVVSLQNMLELVVTCKIEAILWINRS